MHQLRDAARFFGRFWSESRERSKYVRITRRPSRRLYLLHKEQARVLVLAKLEQLNKTYGFRYGRIAIRNQRSRWGSCSKKGNLNFNFRIIFLPERLIDYVVAHELCHLQEFNHSKGFWSLLAQVVPDHKTRRKELMARGVTLLNSLSPRAR